MQETIRREAQDYEQPEKEEEEEEDDDVEAAPEMPPPPQLELVQQLEQLEKEADEQTCADFVQQSHQHSAQV